MKSIQDAREYICWINETIRLDAISDKAKNRKILRGQVYWCYFGINIGSEQSEKRPCVILQNNLGNQSSANTIVAPITHSNSKLAVVVPISNKYDANNKLILDGYVLLGNIVSVSKARLGDFITCLPKEELNLVDAALAKAVDLQWRFEKYENIIKDKDIYIEKLKAINEDKSRELAILLSFIDSDAYAEYKTAVDKYQLP